MSTYATPPQLSRPTSDILLAISDNQASERHRNITGHGATPWRAMFLCQVVAGRTHCTTDADIEEPQIDELLADGHDSVTGEVGPHLNYDEIVVYDEAAAVPNYLIVYALTPS